MTEAEHVEAVRLKATELSAALVAATEDGVSPALILPVLVGIFRSSGMMPG